MAVEFAETAYRLTRSLPREEMFGLTANLRRAATSLSLNIAEGDGRGTNRDFARLVDMAIGSTFETFASFVIAERLGFLCDQDLALIREHADRLARKLNSFKRTLGDEKRPTRSAIGDRRSAR